MLCEFRMGDYDYTQVFCASRGVCQSSAFWELISDLCSAFFYTWKIMEAFFVGKQDDAIVFQKESMCMLDVFRFKRGLQRRPRSTYRQVDR